MSARGTGAAPPMEAPIIPGEVPPAPEDVSGTDMQTPPPGAADSGDGEAQGRKERIAIEAYYRAERRGFEPGRELEDWFAAERDLDEREGDEPDARRS